MSNGEYIGGHILSYDGLPLHMKFSDDYSHGTLLKPFNANCFGYCVNIPEGFVSDWASIPAWLWWFAAPFGPHAPAAVVHDFLYSQASSGIVDFFTRLNVDRTFDEHLRVLGVSMFKRYAMFQAVRLFGGKAWRRVQDAGQVNPFR